MHQDGYVGFFLGWSIVTGFVLRQTWQSVRVEASSGGLRGTGDTLARYVMVIVVVMRGAIAILLWLTDA